MGNIRIFDIRKTAQFAYDGDGIGITGQCTTDPETATLVSFSGQVVKDNAYIGSVSCRQKGDGYTYNISDIPADDADSVWQAVKEIRQLLSPEHTGGAASE